MNQPGQSDGTSNASWLPACIVSGGQTGVDRAALDVAIALGVAHGGWCPAGRLAEDGSVPSRYQLQETESRDYPVRTEQNVIDSDATLILYEGKLAGGTRLTQRFCRRHHRPHLATTIDAANVAVVRQWLEKQRPDRLNVAGPRQSTVEGIHERSFQFLIQVFA